MLKDAIVLANEGPVVIRYPKGVARSVDATDIGSGLVARKLLADDSNTVCILAIGKMVGASLDAAALLLQKESKQPCGTCVHVRRWTRRCLKTLQHTTL